MELVGKWERVKGLLEEGKVTTVMEVLDSMISRLDEWFDKGREWTDEFQEMKLDIMKAMEVVLMKDPDNQTRKSRSSEGGRNAEIKVPDPALCRGEICRPISRTPLPSSSSSARSRHSSKTTPSPQNDRRRESEKLVEEAIERGEPVTLFHDDYPPPPPPLCSPFKSTTLDSPDSPPIILRSGKGEISFLSIRSLEEKYPISPYRHVSRDITPTPDDPYGLRDNSKNLQTPRKRAALYNSPRWPTSGRPSPGTPSPHTRRKEHIQHKDFGVSADHDNVESGYDELDVDDPAEKIWKGIDEEYTPKGGRLTRRRRLRRWGSLRSGVLHDE